MIFLPPVSPDSFNSSSRQAPENSVGLPGWPFDAAEASVLPLCIARVRNSRTVSARSSG